jgi:signal transduction histidine kinase/CheY-like chemotaxis protein
MKSTSSFPEAHQEDRIPTRVESPPAASNGHACPSPEQELAERHRMAGLAALSAGVAHQINNPLTYLSLNLEHVLRKLRAASASDDPMAHLSCSSDGDGSGLQGLVQSLQYAVEGANRVKRVVHDLLTFAQGNAEHHGLVDLRGVLESATQMAWYEIRHRARVSKLLADVPFVEANEARLGQVFFSLLMNAAQSIPEGQADRHEVRVETRTDAQGNAVVEIADTGTGIAPEDLPRIFDPFFTTKGLDSPGLGLAISHGAIKSLGGDIVVTSTAGRGTAFRVVLPPAQGSPRAAATNPGKTTKSLVHRVLVVDDDLLVGRALARALSEENEVEVVTDGREALTRLASGERYDVVLCDLMMPAMAGMDLYAEIVRREPQIASRFVFMTGGTFTPQARAFVESVVNPCLQKPMDLAELRSIVVRSRQHEKC